MIKNQLSFNDGIADIYKTENSADVGDTPQEHLTNKRTARFKYKTVGYNRFNAAMQNNVKISKLIYIPWGVPVSIQDIVIINNNNDEQYEIMQAQDITDSLPRSRLLSLQRIEANYDVEGI